MGESQLHQFLKQTAVRSLEAEGFTTYLEPDWSPISLLDWVSYRPDVFAVRRCCDTDEYAFVECETKPHTSRILDKSTNTIKIQARLMRRTLKRMILTIHSGTIGCLDLKMRRYWGIWLANKVNGEVEVIRMLES